MGKTKVLTMLFTMFLFFKKILFIYFREGKGGRECVIASHAPPTGDLAYNLGVCPRLGIEPVVLWFSGLCSIH